MEALVVFVMINDLYAFSRIYFSCFEFLPHWNVSIDISYLLFTSVHLKKLSRHILIWILKCLAHH